MKKYTHTFIILHGFSMNRKDMLYYKNKFNEYLPDKYHIKYVIPNADKKKITIYRNKKYNSWYDYLTGYCEKEPLININQLLESRIEIHKIIENSAKYHNNDYSKIYLSGMSQGCCMALDAGLTFNKKIGGIIGFKGHVISKTMDDFKIKQNVWVCHGKKDKTIYYDFSKKSYEKLKKLDINVKLLTQNTNHGVKTGIHEQMSEIVKWIEKLT